MTSTSAKQFSGNVTGKWVSFPLLRTTFQPKKVPVRPGSFPVANPVFCHFKVCRFFTSEAGNTDEPGKITHPGYCYVLPGSYIHSKFSV